MAAVWAPLKGMEGRRRMDAGVRCTAGEAKEEVGVVEEEEVSPFLRGWAEEMPQAVVGEVRKNGVEKEEEMREAEEQMWGVGEVVMNGEVVEEEELMEDQG